VKKWKIGDVTITKVLEGEDLAHIPNIFPKATVEAILKLKWLQPHFIEPDGRGIFSYHALVIDTPTKRIVVDTCIGNDKNRMPWEGMHKRQNSFLRDFDNAGFTRESVDVVLCTHLHVDHVGWNTMLVNDKWVPTFPKARYILNKTEYEYWKNPEGCPEGGGWKTVQQLTFEDSVKPVMDAGQIDLVEGKYKVCDEVTLIPTLGHSAGHVSVRITSKGEEALITGDMAHHPSQVAHTDWGLPIDFDPDLAIKTRQEVFSDAADRKILVIGTHWAGATAGRVVREGDSLRFEV
jgi:glyoxylase-like metal-dependent hydrolase (beta-lactamase superfamily II)